MRLRRATRLFLLIELLDLLTTMVGVGLLGMVEYNPLYTAWRIESLMAIKLILAWIVVIVLEQPREYSWLVWVPSVIAFLPLPGNIYMIMSVL